METRWVDPLPCRHTAAAAAAALGLPPALAAILLRRGAATPEFLDPRLAAISPPEELGGAAEAAALLHDAIQRGLRIVLYGDYDVDGVTSLALLSRVLTALGGEVECFLPQRQGEGYGLSPAGVARCITSLRPELLVAVDCGTSSGGEIRRLAARGIEVLVLDHHEPAAGPPPCPIVNPKLGSRFHELCSAGIAFKVLHALLKRLPPPRPDLREYLDLVALGTVADMVPLLGENRPLVRHGLARIARSRWPGVAALARIASVSDPPRSGDIGFRMGPRINAAGRLATAADSLRLLLTDDPAEAACLAQSLDRQNRERQRIEQTVCDEAERWVLERCNPASSATIVAGARDWHQGVLGIVAARLLRKHHRPTIVVGFDSDGHGRGSGRSPANFSLVEALRRCGDLLLTFGGHNMAAGLSLEEGRFDSFRERFEQIGREAGGAELFTPCVEIDADLALEDLDEDFLDAQDRLEPFGTGHPQPVFRARSVSPDSAPRILKDKHLRLEFRAGRLRIPAIFFHGAGIELPRPPWDLAFRVERNTWNGVSRPQLHLVAIRAAR